MNANQLRWIFITFLLGLLVAASIPGLLPKMSLGFSSETVDGQLSISGGTHPVLICFAFALILLYVNSMSVEPSATGASLPGVFRRFVAFYVDFLFAMLTITPIIGIIPTLVEWRTTGTFEWTFERETAAASDHAVMFFTMIFASIALVLWYAVPLVLGRPSPGCLILRYQVVPISPQPIGWRTAISRVLLGFLAGCAWFIAPFIRRDKARGQFWLDKVFDTRAVKLS